MITSSLRLPFISSIQQLKAFSIQIVAELAEMMMMMALLEELEDCAILVVTIMNTRQCVSLKSIALALA